MKIAISTVHGDDEKRWKNFCRENYVVVGGNDFGNPVLKEVSEIIC